MGCGDVLLKNGDRARRAGNHFLRPGFELQGWASRIIIGQAGRLRDTMGPMTPSPYASFLRRAWPVVVLVLLVIAAAAVMQFGKLGIEFQTTTLLDQKDPELKVYEQLHETKSWSQNEFAVVCASGIDWVTPEGAAKLKQLVAELEAGPEVGGTMSLLTTPLLRRRISGLVDNRL